MLSIFNVYSIFWVSRSKNIDQELFIISKLSIKDGGPDYLITCSLNGDTLIMDQTSQHSTFKFEESVSAFCCGMYTVKPNTKSLPSFVFITNSQKVYTFFSFIIFWMQVFCRLTIIIRLFEKCLLHYFIQKITLKFV